MRWLTSMNKKRHQREINRLVREANKSIEKDDLWHGRFCIKQVESPQWHVYEDKSGAEYFVHIKFIISSRRISVNTTLVPFPSQTTYHKSIETISPLNLECLQ